MTTPTIDTEEFDRPSLASSPSRQTLTVSSAGDPNRRELWFDDRRSWSSPWIIATPCGANADILRSSRATRSHRRTRLRGSLPDRQSSGDVVDG